MGFSIANFWCVMLLAVSVRGLRSGTTDGRAERGREGERLWPAMAVLLETSHGGQHGT